MVANIKTPAQATAERAYLFQMRKARKAISAGCTDAVVLVANSVADSGVGVMVKGKQAHLLLAEAMVENDDFKDLMELALVTVNQWRNKQLEDDESSPDKS